MKTVSRIFDFLLSSFVIVGAGLLTAFFLCGLIFG
jgi:hypothetical protein